MALVLGSPLVAFSLKGTDGKVHSAEDHRGATVLAVTW